MTRLAAAVLAVTVAGCGLTQTRGPDPRQPPHQRPTCTESFDAPKRDAFGAIAGFGSLLVGLLFLEAGDNDEVGVPLIIGGAVLMAGSYVSGGIGYFRVKRCRKAIADFERRSPPPPPSGMPPPSGVPPPYPPPPPPPPAPGSPPS